MTMFWKVPMETAAKFGVIFEKILKESVKPRDEQEHDMRLEQAISMVLERHPDLKPTLASLLRREEHVIESDSPCGAPLPADIAPRHDAAAGALPLQGGEEHRQVQQPPWPSLASSDWLDRRRRLRGRRVRKKVRKMTRGEPPLIRRARRSSSASPAQPKFYSWDTDD
ncbi:uncharacterized protein [Aegilops tauschii subsp. strangulata]